MFTQCVVQHTHLLPECSKNFFLQLLSLCVIQCTGGSCGALWSGWPLLSISTIVSWWALSPRSSYHAVQSITSRPGGPGCPSLPSFPGSPGRQDALVTGQVSAASGVRYTAVKQVRATRNLTVRGGICHLQLFFSSMLQPIARRLLVYNLLWELLPWFACLLALIC